MWRWLIVLVGCGSSAPADGPAAKFTASVIATLPSTSAYAIATLDADRIAVLRHTVVGDAFCPDCVDLDPSQCPSICTRTQLSVGIVGTSADIFVGEVFPQTFDHRVNQIELVSLGGDHVGVAWLDCDNKSCGSFLSGQTCTAYYTTVDLDRGIVGSIATLYQNRFAKLQLVANPATREVLAVTGLSYGAWGAGTSAAIFSETGNQLMPWTKLGGRVALSPAAAATAEGFAIVIDDRRPNDTSAANCTTSCQCFASPVVDGINGGLYGYEVTSRGVQRSDGIAVGLTQDGHLENGHYHEREVLALMRRGGELVVAGGQAFGDEAELYVGRRDAWVTHAGFDAPIPLWIGVMGLGDTLAWLGSEPNPEDATVNQIVVGAVRGTEIEQRTLTEPVDSSITDVAPVITPDGIPKTFVLRGLFQRDGGVVTYTAYEILEVATE